MVPSKAVLMRPVCFKTIAELSCRLRDALRICKVLHQCVVHMPVHSALACYIWYRDPDNMQYNRQFGLLCCSVDSEYTLRSVIFFQWRHFFTCIKAHHDSVWQITRLTLPPKVHRA